MSSVDPGSSGVKPMTAQELLELIGPATLLNVARGKKAPILKGWQKLKPSDMTPNYLSGLNHNNNIGVSLGAASERLCTIDCDSEEHVKEFLALNPGLASTLISQASRGANFWIRIKGAYPKSCKLKTKDGTPWGEWRADGNQTVLQGQHTTGKSYRHNSAKPDGKAFDEIVWPDLELPWLAEAEGQPNGMSMSPELAKRVESYLEECSPSISGKGGDVGLFRTACKIANGFDLDEEQTYQALARWYNPRCKPPWKEDRLRHKAAEAQKVPHHEPRGHLLNEEKVSWPDLPQPLHVQMRPVATLRAEMIPEPLRPWLTDVAHRMQCPLDFVATAAICMVSGVIGAGCTIRPKERDNWSVVPNLWGGVIARSGMKKTPAIEEAFKPLRRLEHLAKEKHEAGMNDHAAELVAFEAQRKALKAEMDKAAREGRKMDQIKADYAGLKPPESPPRRRFITSDTTIEKASELMKDNPRGLTILRDELVGLLVTWDREDRKDDRCFHLQGWNGYGSYTSDRIGRGTIDTPQLCEVIFGGIQPSKFLVYLKLARNNIENDGLLQRFQLLVHPDELAGKPEIVDEYPDQEARDRVWATIEKLSEMDLIECGGQIDEFTKIPYFHFSPAAQVFFNEWLLALETKLRCNDDDPIISEHLSKYPKLMPSLALIFHLIEVANRPPAPQLSKRKGDAFADQPNEVPLLCAKQAAQWCAYLETHARRIYGLISNLTIQGGEADFGQDRGWFA